MPDLGALEHHNGVDVLRYVRRVAHPIERVWAALTDRRDLAGWWGDARIELAVGGRFDVRCLDAEGPLRTATITALEPPHVLETDGEPQGRLRFELEPLGRAGTLLTLLVRVEVPEGHRGRTLAGWHWHLDALEATLAGMPQAWDPRNPHPGWPEVVARYGVEDPPG